MKMGESGFFSLEKEILHRDLIMVFPSYTGLEREVERDFLQRSVVTGQRAMDLN